MKRTQTDQMMPMHAYQGFEKRNATKTTNIDNIECRMQCNDDADYVVSFVYPGSRFLSFSSPLFIYLIVNDVTITLLTTKNKE